jgi:hypothetical protein
MKIAYPGVVLARTLIASSRAQALLSFRATGPISTRHQSEDRDFDTAPLLPRAAHSAQSK